MKNGRTVLNVLLCFAVLSPLLLSRPARAFAQDNPDYEADLKRALELIQAYKMPEAAPILEKLHAAKPDDAVVLEALSLSIFATSPAEKDAEKRKKQVLRARSLAERAKELGRNTQLIRLLLEQIPTDGETSSPAASEKISPAGEALVEGEAAFAKGEMERAITI
jgi:thioredoxin-like negative regulator of GroEL